MKRLLIVALIAGAFWPATPAAHAVCAHNHDGSTHVHSGKCDGACTPAEDSGLIPDCGGFGVDVPIVDQAVCLLAAAVNTELVQC